ncbi:hypothetical protein [Streptomyces sp. NPDC102476]|uniref:hypothetical protein n=1 Tax=Streptomyces sp. NPDC102476 TaxID=3366181 RepID=UPI0038068CE3
MAIVSAAGAGELTVRRDRLPRAAVRQGELERGMMGTTNIADTAADLETYATPRQQIRFVRAMSQLANQRVAGEPVSVYISVPPEISQTPRWQQWRARIEAALPDGVRTSTFEETFRDGRQYIWDTFAESLDGLIIVGKQKRPGSRVFLVGPVARLELRAMVAHRPVLLYAHDLGLVPVVDCKPEPLPHPHKGTRLKLTVPRRWKRASETQSSALAALQPRTEAVTRPADHLLHPFDTTSHQRSRA